MCLMQIVQALIRHRCLRCLIWGLFYLPMFYLWNARHKWKSMQLRFDILPVYANKHVGADRVLVWIQKRKYLNIVLHVSIL